MPDVRGCVHSALDHACIKPLQHKRRMGFRNLWDNKNHGDAGQLVTYI